MGLLDLFTKRDAKKTLSSPAAGTSREDYSAAYDRAEPFSKVTPCSLFDIEEGIVHLSDFTMGMAWFLEPIPTSHLDGQSKHAIAKMIAGSIGRLPDGARLQVMACPSRNIDHPVANYLKQGGTKNPIYAEIERSKVAQYNEGVNGTGIRCGDLDYCIKSHRIMVTLVVEPPGLLTSVRNVGQDAMSKPKRSAAGLGPLESPAMDAEVLELPGVARYTRAYANYKKLLLQAAQTLESTFAGIKPAVEFRRCSKDEFIRFFHAATQLHSGVRSKAKHSSHDLLPEQLMRKDVRFLPEGLILCDGFFHGVITVDDYPTEVNAGMLSEPHPNLGMNTLLDYVIDGTVCINIYNPRRQDIASWNAKRYKLANEGDGDPIERGVIIEESKLIRTWTAQEGRRIVEMQISVSMADREKHQVLARLEHVQSKLQEMGFRTRIEESAAHLFWAHQLPFGWKPSLGKARRVKRRVDLVAANLMPIYLMGTGTKSKAYMALNQRGEPIGLDFFESRSAFNFAIFAESGGGKSVLANAITADYCRNDRFQMLIIDQGGSYRPQIQVAGDAVAIDCQLSASVKTSINPFDGVYEIVSPMLMEWIPFLALNRNEELNVSLRGKMEKTLRAVFANKLRRDIPYRSTAELLEKYPGFHIDRQAKRLPIRALRGDEIKQLAEIKQAMSQGNEAPRFEVYNIIRLLGATDKKGRRDRLESVGQLSREERDKLRLDHAYLQDDDQGVYLLTKDPNGVNSLAFDGYECNLVKDTMVAEAADVRDWEILERFGVKVVFPREYLDRKRSELQVSIADRYADVASEDQLLRALDEEIENLPSIDYFRELVGTADLQEPVFFREFGRAMADSTDADLKDLATRLAPYYGSGPYSSYFDKPTSFNLFGKKLVSWDFEQLMKGDIKLVGAVLGALYQMLMVYCTSPRTVGIRKIIFTDEYAKFQECWITDRFSELVARQGRKYGFAVGIGTQSIKDLKNDRIDLLQHMQHFLIGPQQEGVVASMKESMGLTAVQRARIMNIANSKGIWSEFVLYIPGAKVFETMRIVLNPTLYWMFTSDPLDKEERKKLQNKYALEGFKPSEAILRAITECSRAYPRGISEYRKRMLK